MDTHNRYHVWEKEISAQQLNKIVKKCDLRTYICILKDVEEFHEKVNKAMDGKPSYLRKVLEDHEEVFSRVTGLPPKRPTDHRIDLVPGATPPQHCTYHMNEKELKLLKEG